jgi:MerR family transcriptional regulator, light-induced transcriptional regulator
VALGGMLSIGALARATDIPVETLRTWERRYGYPLPVRKSSGHRVYPLATVGRLRRIAEALARGHRAGDVVGVSDQVLAGLLRATPLRDAEPLTPLAAGSGVGETLREAVAALDAERLTRVLLSEYARIGLLPFLRECVGPLLHDVGEDWAAGRLTVGHEHFVTERVGDLLRSLRLPAEARARGPLMVLASLPGEAHGLGLQMAALVLAHAGCRVRQLGTEVPPVHLVELARAVRARGIGLSVSRSSAGPAMARAVVRLRAALPRRTLLVVGGAGAPAPRSGIDVVRDLARLDAWARDLARAASA